MASNVKSRNITSDDVRSWASERQVVFITVTVCGMRWHAPCALFVTQKRSRSQIYCTNLLGYLIAKDDWPGWAEVLSVS